jgi:DNA-binding MarR family transcriptional regulator
MTTIQESPRPTAPIGQAVGQAEASLTKLLAGVLAESGTSHEAYLGLQRLTTLGGQATRDAYERDLIDWLRLDGPGARRLADELVSAGLVAVGLVAVEPNGAAGPAGGGIVRLTSQGVALRAAILGASAKITEPMLATIDRDDLETTVRTLNEITRRARGIPDRLVTTEESR